VVNQLIILVLLSFGLLVVCFIIGIAGIFKALLKKKSDEYLIFIIFVGIVLIFLIPVILGMIKDLNL
jgi:hypothetical protein